MTRTTGVLTNAGACTGHADSNETRKGYQYKANTNFHGDALPRLYPKDLTRASIFSMYARIQKLSRKLKTYSISSHYRAVRLRHHTNRGMVSATSRPLTSSSQMTLDRTTNFEPSPEKNRKLKITRTICQVKHKIAISRHLQRAL